MSRPMMILGVALFALATAVLYVWGLKKSVSQQGDLERVLMAKCAGRVVKHLKRSGTVTEAEMATLITGVQAGQFWSKKRVAVQTPKVFAGQLAAFMLDQQLVERTEKKQEYRLRR